MIGFKLWGRFAVFRDPLTITQNLTFPIPPKTTIGGMLAAILGIEYSDYFKDKDFFNFKYSLVITKPTRKMNFTQNYIADYTKVSENKFHTMKKYFITKMNFMELIAKKTNMSEEDEELFLNISKKIEKKEQEYEKRLKKYKSIMKKVFPKPKPIFRELLIDPEYLVFIIDFKYEDDIADLLKNHYSSYSLYMGNTEFAANYSQISCLPEYRKISKLDSFTAHPEEITFEPGKKYTSIYVATSVTNEREYRDYKNIIICDKEIRIKNDIDGYIIKTENRNYSCEFI